MLVLTLGGAVSVKHTSSVLVEILTLCKCTEVVGDRFKTILGFLMSSWAIV